MRASAIVVALSLWCVGASGNASVFKCEGEKGSVVYQDAPCGPGKELRNFDTDPPALTVLPATPATASAAARSASERAEKPGRDTARQQADDRRAADRKFVRSGMSEAEVVQRLGRPDVTTGGNGRKSGRRWAYLPRPGDPDTMTTLTLQGGSVVDVERKVVR